MRNLFQEAREEGRAEARREVHKQAVAGVMKSLGFIRYQAEELLIVREGPRVDVSF